MTKLKQKLTLIAAIILSCSLMPSAIFAAGGGGGSSEGTDPQKNSGSLPWTRFCYLEGNTGHERNVQKRYKEFLEPMSQGGSGGGGASAAAAGGGGGGGGGGGKQPQQLKDAQEPIILPGHLWPKVTPPEKWNPVKKYYQIDYETDQVQMTDVDKALPVTDIEYYVLNMKKENERIEKTFDPGRALHMAEAMEQMTAGNAANSVNGVAANQAQNAIDVVRYTIVNFTADPTSPFQLLRSQLFLPMAVLLLLAGAVAAQARAIVAQGSPILGDISPFEGLTRSVVAIFLIPGSFLVINYGIDVANSITFTISDEYTKLFGSDMYQDAQFGERKAATANPMQNNDNYIPPEEPSNQQASQGAGTTPWDQFEQQSIATEQDQKSGKPKTDYTDEEQPSEMAANRLAMGAANAGLAMTWNILCAFQMAYLYYLWCMGPIAAALWVWPMERLRGAFPSWVEGVVTLCFWSLFWNTVILLMACFQGVGQGTGTVIMTALNGMATLCVQYAFDFSSLISQGAASQLAGAVAQGMKGASGGGGGQQSGGGARSAGGQRGGGMPAMAGAGGRGLPQGGALALAGGQGGPGLGAGSMVLDNATFAPGGGGGFNPRSGGGAGSPGGSPFMPVSYNPGADGGVPRALGLAGATDAPGVAGMSPRDIMPAAAMLAAARNGLNGDAVSDNMKALGAPNNDRDLPGWLNNLANAGAMDPKNPYGGSALADYLKNNPTDPSAAGFADWLAHHGQQSPVQDFLNDPNQDPNSKLALAQFLAEHPNTSLNNDNLNNFLQGHDGRGFTVSELNHDLGGPNGLGLPPSADPLLAGNGPGLPLNPDAAGPPNGLPIDGHRNLEIVDPNTGHQYHLGQDGRLVDNNLATNPNFPYDPNNPPPLHGLSPDPAHNLPGTLPEGLIARDGNTGEIIAAYNGNSWTGANSGGLVHFDPVTQTGTVDGINGTFAPKDGHWDMLRSGEGTPLSGLSLNPETGNLSIAGSHFGVEQLNHPGSPPIYQATLDNGQHLQSMDGQHWYRTAESGGATTWTGHALEHNGNAGGFSIADSHGSLVMGDNGAFHFPGNSQVVNETPQGFSTVQHGATWTSGNGYDWTPAGGGSMSYHHEQSGGFISSSGSVVYGDHGMHLSHSDMPVMQSGNMLTATDATGHVYQSSDNGASWRMPDGTPGGSIDYRWEPQVGMASGSMVSGDSGLHLRNSDLPIARSEYGGYSVNDGAGHTYNSTDGRTWHVQEGSVSTTGGTNVTYGDTPTYNWDQNNHVFRNEALTPQVGGQEFQMRTASGEMPVHVQTDNTGHTIYTGDYAGHSIYSSDGGTTWHGYGQNAGENYAIRQGELTAINNAGESIPYGTASGTSYGSGTVNYDQDGHALSRFVPDANQVYPPTNVSESSIYGGPPAGVNYSYDSSGNLVASSGPGNSFVNYDREGQVVTGFLPEGVGPYVPSNNIAETTIYGGAPLPSGGVSYTYDSPGTSGPTSQPMLAFTGEPGPVSSAPAFGNYYVGSESSSTHCVIPGTNLQATFDESSRNWLVDGSNGQVTYNREGDGGMTVTGSNVTADYDGSGRFYSYAAGTEYPVVLQGNDWAMKTDYGDIPTHVRGDNWVPDQVGIVAPTAQFVEPNLTEFHAPSQPDSLTFAGAQVEDTSWNLAPTQDHPVVAFEAPADHHLGEAIGGVFVGDTARQNPPTPDSPFQPSTTAVPIVPVPITSSTPVSNPFSGRLRSLVAGTQSGSQSPLTPRSAPGERQGEDLHTQMMRADRRRGRKLTKAEQVQLLRDSGYHVDDDGNLLT